MIPEAVTLLTTLLYIAYTNWICALGFIPFVYIIYNTKYVAGSSIKILEDWWLFNREEFRKNETEI
jgi:hypothetical protein